MTIFKRIFTALLGVGMFFAVSPGAKAVPVNVSFSEIILTTGGTAFGTAGADTWSLSFVVDNGGLSTASQTWGLSDIVGNVTGTSNNGYSATYGTSVGAGGFSLTTNAGGGVSAATYSDLAESDNSDSVGAAIVLHTFGGVGAGGPTSDSDFALLLFGTNNLASLWTVDLGQATEAPEPGAIALFGIGLVGLAIVRRRKKKMA